MHSQYWRLTVRRFCMGVSLATAIAATLAGCSSSASPPSRTGQSSPSSSVAPSSSTTLAPADPVIIRGSAYGFSGPSAVTVDSNNVYVANGTGSSLTTFSVTGRGTPTIVTAIGPMSHPDAIVGDGPSVIALSSASNTVDCFVYNEGFGWGDGASKGIADPTAVAEHGTDAWVANAGDDSVLELSQQVNGFVLRTDAGTHYGFDDPDGIAVDPSTGTVWVSNFKSNSLTELRSSGAFERTVSSGASGLDGPRSVLAVDGDVWVLNTLGNSLTEVDASTGQVLRVISASEGRLSKPTALATDGSHLFANAGNNSLSEISAATGKLVRVISGAKYGIDDPSGVAVGGRYIWVTNAANNTVSGIPL